MVKGFGRITVSRGLWCGAENHGFVRFPVNHVSETGIQISWCEVREILENFFSAHACCEVRHHILDRDSHSSDAGFTTALFGFKGDDIAPVHAFMVAPNRFKHDQNRWNLLQSHPRASPSRPTHHETSFLDHFWYANPCGGLIFRVCYAPNA